MPAFAGMTDFEHLATGLMETASPHPFRLQPSVEERSASGCQAPCGNSVTVPDCFCAAPVIGNCDFQPIEPLQRRRELAMILEWQSPEAGQR
jgi:hypothetical protein